MTIANNLKDISYYTKVSNDNVGGQWPDSVCKSSERAEESALIGYSVTNQSMRLKVTYQAFYCKNVNYKKELKKYINL